MRRSIVMLLAMCLAWPALAQQEAFVEDFSKVEKAPWGTVEPTGGVDGSAYLKSKPGAYSVYSAKIGEFKFDTTYKISMMVKTSTGAVPQVLPKLTQGKLYLWHSVKRTRKMGVTDEWTPIEFTFKLSRQQLEKSGQAMVKGYEKAKAKNPDAKPNVLARSWMTGKADLDKPLTLTVTVYNWSSDKRAKAGDKVEASQMSIDNLTVEQLPAEDQGQPE